MPYYAVRNGRNPGVVHTNWSECEQNVKGYSGASFKKFNTLAEAQDFVASSNQGYTGGASSNTAFCGVAIVNPGYRNMPSSSRGYSNGASNGLGYNNASSCRGYSNATSSNHAYAGTILVDREYSSETSSNHAYSGAISLKPGYNGAISISPEYSSRTSSNRGYGSGSGGSSSSRSHPFSVTNGPSSGRNIVYTDGSCINNGQVGASAGFGFYFPEASKGYYGHLEHGSNQTNQRAELEAIKQAIRYAQSDPRDLEIRTDSKYAVEGLANWSRNWEKDWNSAQVVNKKEFKEIIDLAKSQNKHIYLKHVPGHNGEPGNEQAHRLALKGATG